MFWDSSALIPLLVPEDRSAEIAELFASDSAVAIWWASPVECVSALERRRREGGLEPEVYHEALGRLREVADQSAVVQAAARVRDRAERLLALHPLRAGDALQLAAALVACDEGPRGSAFVCLDERLREAASREGFRVEPPA